MVSFTLPQPKVRPEVCWYTIPKPEECVRINIVKVAEFSGERSTTLQVVGRTLEIEPMSCHEGVTSVLIHLPHR